MKKHMTGLAQISLLAVIAVTLVHSTHATACELHDNLTLQNSFGDFHLPSVGDNATNIVRVYGEPLRKLNGINGLNVWDYGSFRVMLKNNRVTFAGMW